MSIQGHGSICIVDVIDIISTIANPSKGGDAKPRVYRYAGMCDQDRPAAER
jgi:hypothetical protein